MLMRMMAFLCAALILCGSALAEGGVAGEQDMTDVIDIVPEGMTPVTGDMLNDGEYKVGVTTSSAMFKLTGAVITVDGGAIAARLLTESGSYSFMYAGSAEEAASADESTWIPLTEDGNLRYFAMPISALNAGVECASFSARKALWYPRVILLTADSLPLSAWRAEYLTTVSSLELADGEYLCDVTLTGNGRASLESPAHMTVTDGACAAKITFSTSKIDYVLVDGEKYLPESTEGGARFVVPVAAFDLPIGIVVDSTAIKPATEVSYTMIFDSASIAAQ